MASDQPSGQTSAVDRDGYAMVRGMFGQDQVSTWRESIDSALAVGAEASSAVLSHRGRAYASRNLLDVWPAAIDLSRSLQLTIAITEILGPGCGLVRGLLFDKPPEQTWSLPWHQDMTIAVRDNQLPTTNFSKPTNKSGVPHVEAPLEVLQRMVTARVHLDAVTDENGPLRVIAGSHHWGKTMLFERTPQGQAPVVETIYANAGDVLLMRPLVAHSSLSSQPGTTRHRRIVHLEFAASDPLPDGFSWNQFDPIGDP